MRTALKDAIELAETKFIRRYTGGLNPIASRGDIIANIAIEVSEDESLFLYSEIDLLTGKPNGRHDEVRAKIEDFIKIYLWEVAGVLG